MISKYGETSGKHNGTNTIDNKEKLVLKQLSDFIFTSRYSRYREDLKRRETWDEAVSRVENMHLSKFSLLSEQYKQEIKNAFNYVRDKKVVPSMRLLQFGGKAVEVNESRSYNCAVRHVESIDAFGEIFFLLLSGCGVGIGISQRHTDKLPNLIHKNKQEYVYKYTIQDTIEGWADSIKVLLSGYLEGTALSGCVIEFDYSEIRAKGTPLKTSGGKAPGSEGLRRSLNKIQQLLISKVKSDSKRLKTIDVYDILMHSADAVLSGGIRRAATSVIFDRDDYDLLNAKTGNWFMENPQRARSNNSVLLLREKITFEDFKDVIDRTREWGEPGFVFADHKDTLLNPCFETTMLPITASGKCGVQYCNLSSINGAKISGENDFYECVKAASIIGTLQASYTNFTYLSKEAKELTEEEALLGVSITGMMENPDILLNKNIQKQGASIAKRENEKWAGILGINPSSRICLVKPEGSSSLVLGTMASGIHPAHSHKMFRRVQMNKMDDVYQFFKKHNPHLCEESVWSTNRTDDVISFPITVSKESIVKNQLSAVEHLKIIKDTQENWVVEGTTKYNKKPLVHSVSCTVIVKEDEWDDVLHYIYDNREFFTAVSLLASTGDKDYQQAPMEAVSTQEDEIRFNYLLENFVPVNYADLYEDDDKTSLADTEICAGGLCSLEYLQTVAS